MSTLSTMLYDLLPDASLIEPMLKLVLAAVLGGVVGIEREARGRPAGFRTHLLVCVGCCLVMIVSISFPSHYAELYPDDDNIVRIDPARLAYGVMTGIGFIGAGAIIKLGITVRGLTTAATIWCVAAIGLTIGFAMYWTAIGATAVIYASLVLLSGIEGWLSPRWYKRVKLRCKSADQIESVQEIFRKKRIRISDMGFETAQDGSGIVLRVAINYSGRDRTPGLLKDFLTHPELEFVSLK